MRISLIREEKRRYPEPPPLPPVRPHQHYNNRYRGFNQGVSLSKWCEHPYPQHSTCMVQWCDCPCHDDERDWMMGV